MDFSRSTIGYGRESSVLACVLDIHAAATQTLSQQFTETDMILSKRLDKLVFQFKETAPDFFNAYQTARSIVDLRGPRKMNDPPTPTSVPQPA